MNNPFREKKTPRQSDEVSPFDTAENYYGDTTNPAHMKKNGRLGKVRTFSVFENNSRSLFFDDDDNRVPCIDPLSRPNSRLPSSNLPPVKSVDDLTLGEKRHTCKSPPPGRPREPSIMPIYRDVPSDEDLIDKVAKVLSQKPVNQLYRRASVDDSYLRPKCFYISDIDLILRELLKNEDTDHNYQITIEDNGPKVLKLGTVNSNGFRSTPVRGTYMLSNLLQELTIAKRFGRNQMILDERRLSENPVFRMKRLITTQFWPNLTRELNKNNIVEMSADTKILDEIKDKDGKIIGKKESHRVYVPYNRADQFEYFSKIKEERPNIDIDVQYLPTVIDGDYVRSINKKPGLLSLSSRPDPKKKGNMINQPYVVPGGRFNELYGWDSYFETLGLLIDVTKEDQRFLPLARGMAENFIYEIDHYGKILNANRSYYLSRSQPPFLTDMALRIYRKTVEVTPENTDDAKDFLLRAIQAAIKEYNEVWTAVPRLDEKTGLSCYHPDGKGIPPETEATHFCSILRPYIEKYGVSQEEFIEMYNSEKIHEPELDEYFLHDRAVRESGHDTSYRLEGRCAYLATVDLNSLLYKYEIDIAYVIENFTDNKLVNAHNSDIETKEKWIAKAKLRQEKITKYLWNERDSIYYDYHIKKCSQAEYESATTFWPLWAGVATKDQARKLVENSLSKFEEFGGLVAGTLRSRGPVNISRPSRQWDYPYGWAPHQILAWIGLMDYGYEKIARRLAYRWLYMMTQAFVDYNGVVVEKYNITRGAVPHRVDAEYGNQGADFKGVATEGFGWVNASYVFGLSLLDVRAHRSLGALTPIDVYIRHLHKLSASKSSKQR